MGKLVIRSEGKSVEEVNLKLGDTKIGRKPGCDIILDDAGVSGEHAVIKTVGLKSVILDLDSTNGTYVENQRVKQHELRNGETITIGKHSLIYRDIVDLDAPAFAPQSSKSALGSSAREPETAVLPRFGQLLAVEGPDKGKRVALVKEVITLDNPGKNPARISRTAEGYVLTASAGAGEARLNDKPVPPGGQLLKNGDIIEVAGTKYEMYK